jgi:hypothetical protein
MSEDEGHLDDADEADDAGEGGDGEVRGQEAPDDADGVELVLFRALPLGLGLPSEGLPEGEEVGGGGEVEGGAAKGEGKGGGSGVGRHEGEEEKRPS